MKLRNQIPLLLILLVLQVTAFADKTDDFMRAQIEWKHIPGAAVVVVRNGKIIKAKGYGFASLEFDVPAEANTVFEIGSVTKQFTAACIMMLVQDGKINLDAPVSTYLDGTPEDWAPITVRMLLTHTSGIPSYTRIGGFELWRRYTAKDAVEELAKHPMDFAPGEKYLYNNSAFNLLGYIIEKASGMTYWQFLRTRIFIPLGMSDSNNRDPQFLLKRRANGYEYEDGAYHGRDGNLTDLFSAGAIVSTVNDMAKWEIALEGDKFLNEKSKAEMWRKQKLNSGEELNYGFGWILGDFRGEKTISHSGQTAGFAANFSRFVDKGITVIVLSNSGTQGAGTELARGVAKVYIPNISIRAMKPIEDKNVAETAQFRNDFERMLNGDDFSKRATEPLFRKLHSAETKAEFTNLKKNGNVQSFERAESDGKGNTIFRVLTKKNAYLVRFAQTADGKLKDFTLLEIE